MKNKSMISVILTAVSVIITTFLFFYWTNEENRDFLFKFNLGYTLFLEILFFGFVYFIKTSNQKILGATYSVLGTILFFYLFFGAFVLLSFNIILVNIISIKWYYSIIVIGSLLTVIISGLLMKVNNNFVRSTERENNIEKTRDSYIQSLIYLQNIYANILKENKINEKFESDYSTIIQKLTNKLSFINPKILGNTNNNTKLSVSIRILEKLITEMKNPKSDRAIIHRQIAELVNDTIFYLNSLK